MRPLGAALAGTLAVGAVARAVAPPVIPWREADRHIGEIVTLEGVVAAVQTTGDAWILEFAPDDAHAARVVLVVPLLSSLPRAPERLYVDRRVQASGLLRRFQGRPEMVLRNPAQLEVVDVAGPPAEPVVRATPPSTAVAPPAAAAAPGRTAEPAAVAPRAPAAPATPPPAPAPSAPPAPVAKAAGPSSAPDSATPGPPPTAPARALAEEVARRVAAAAPCERAKAHWRDAAGRAGDLANRLGRCVAEESYRCRVESAALAPALTDLEWAEQQVDEACR